MRANLPDLLTAVLFSLVPSSILVFLFMRTFALYTRGVEDFEIGLKQPKQFVAFLTFTILLAGLFIWMVRTLQLL